MPGVDTGGYTTLAPEEAFAVVGDETRIAILQALGEAGERLPFSDLRERVGVRDPGRFNYHLNRLTDHFVRKTDEHYELTRAGERIVEAVLAGTVTSAPVVDRTMVDQSCYFCGAPVEVRYYQERLERYCTECPGMWGSQEGKLGRLSLPPAGLQGRSIDEAARAAFTWQVLNMYAIGAGICPRCSAPLERELDLCTSHEAPGIDTADGLCEECGVRHAARLVFRCPSCIFEGRGTLPIAFNSHPAMLAILANHGHSPITPTSIADVQRVHSDYEEEILSTHPFVGRFTFTADGETLTMTVNEDLEVVETGLTRGRDDPNSEVALERDN